MLLASQGFPANLRGRKYSEIWTFVFTHRHYFLVWGYRIGMPGAVHDSLPYIKFVKMGSFVFDNSFYNSFRLLSNQEHLAEHRSSVELIMSEEGQMSCLELRVEISFF